MNYCKQTNTIWKWVLIIYNFIRTLPHTVYLYSLYHIILSSHQMHFLKSLASYISILFFSPLSLSPNHWEDKWRVCDRAGWIIIELIFACLLPKEKKNKFTMFAFFHFTHRTYYHKLFFLSFLSTKQHYWVKSFTCLRVELEDGSTVCENYDDVYTLNQLCFGVFFFLRVLFWNCIFLNFKILCFSFLNYCKSLVLFLWKISGGAITFFFILFSFFL